MYYEINVAKDKKHFFATTERSCQSLEEMQRVFFEIFKRFPISEGYSVSVTRYENTGTSVDPTLCFPPRRFLEQEAAKRGKKKR
jgi:hypothetical protein